MHTRAMAPRATLFCATLVGAVLLPTAASALPPQLVSATGLALLPVIAVVTTVVVFVLARTTIRRGWAFAVAVVTGVAILVLSGPSQNDDRDLRRIFGQAAQAAADRTMGSLWAYPAQLPSPLATFAWWDLRQPEDYLEGHVSDAKNLPLFPEGREPWHDLALLAADIIHDEMEARGDGRPVMVSCYRGDALGPMVAAALRQRGKEAQAIFGGELALDNARLLVAHDGQAGPRLPPAVSAPLARTWAKRSDVVPVRLDVETLRVWMRAPDAPEPLRAASPDSTVLVTIDPPGSRGHAQVLARRLREWGLPRVAWNDAGARPWDASLLRVGAWLEGHSAGLWWVALPLLWLLLMLWRFDVALRRRLVSRWSGELRALQTAGAVVLAVFIEWAWHGTTAGAFVPTVDALEPAARGGLQLAVGAALLVRLQRPQSSILAGAVARLREAAGGRAGHEPGLPPSRWKPAAWALLGGLAAAKVSPALATATVIGLAGEVVSELVLVRLREARLRRAPGGAVQHLLRLAGLPFVASRADEGETITSRSRTEHPARIAVAPPAAAQLRLGLFTGASADGSEVEPLVANVARWTRIGATVVQGDVELVWDARGRGIRTARLEPAEPREAADVLHAQLLHLAWHLPARWQPGDPSPAISAERYADAVTAPTPLSFDLLAARLGRNGGATRAARDLGMRPVRRTLLRLGAAPYEVVVAEGNARTPGRLSRRLARLVLRNAWHRWRQVVVPAAARRIARVRTSSPQRAWLQRGVRQLAGEAARFPELIALAGELVMERDAPSLKRGSTNRRSPRLALDGRGYELCPRDGESAGEAVLLPSVTDSPHDALRSLDALREATRRLYLSELHALGDALLRDGERRELGADIFFLRWEELEALWAGATADRDTLRARRVEHELLGDLHLAETVTLASLEETASGESEATMLRGRWVAGAGPVEGPLAHAAERGDPVAETAIAALPRLDPRAVVRHRNAAALVAESGGLLSHGAILARELGCRALVGVGPALRRLPEGAYVSLAAEGTVHVPAPPDGEPRQEERAACAHASTAGVDRLWLPLEEVGDANLAGGKAASLARMLRAELPVPRGVALTVAATANLTAPRTAEALAQAIGWLAAEIPADRLIVRSSALAEDSATASFAGLLRSEVVPAVIDDVAAAVTRCRSAADDSAVNEYAAAKGLPTPLAMGLVVQPWLAASVGGVALSGPGAGGSILVEATAGGPQRVVDGTVTPETVTLSRDGQKVALPDAAPDWLRAVPWAALAAAVVRCEELLQAPADVEWLVADGRLWFVQARPVTT